jgi:hypothetical protein
MEAMREAWSDDRLDDLNHKVYEGFRRVDADVRSLRTETKAEFRSLRGEMNERFDRVDDRFDRLNGRFDAMQRTLILLCVGITAVVLGVIASIIATGA